MGFPAKLRDMNLHLGGIGHRGIVSETTLPKLALKVLEYRAGGMLGSLDAAVGLEKLVLEFTNAGLVDSALKDFGDVAYDSVIARFSGAYQEDGTGSVRQCVITVLGRYTEIDMGNSKVGDDTAHKAKITCAYYQMDVDGVNWITIDIMNGVFIVFGVDRYADIRAAIAD